MSTPASLFPSSFTSAEQQQQAELEHVRQMAAQLEQIEQALASASHGVDEQANGVTLSTDDLFESFLASTTPHPSTHSLTGGQEGMEATSESDAPSSPSSLPPLSPVSTSSPLPSPVLSPIGSLPCSPSSFSLDSSASDFSSPPSSPSESSPSPAPARRKYTKRKASIASIASTASTTSTTPPTPSAFPVKRRGVKRELPASVLDELDPCVAKKERRKQQNRNAAATSREKKQRYMAEMEARIEALMREQQQLADDVQRLQQQNQQLKQQVTEREGSAVAVKAEAAVKVEAEEQLAVAQVSEHVSQDHVSACAAPAVECVEWEEGGSECGERSGLESAPRDVYHESAVLGAPQWQTSRAPTHAPTPLPLLPLPLLTTTLCLLFHSTMLLLSTLCLSTPTPTRFSTTRFSTRTTSCSPAATTTRRTTTTCSSLYEQTTDIELSDMDGGHCSIPLSLSAFPSSSASLTSLHGQPALMCR